MHDVLLMVGGQHYGGWQTGNIQRGLEQVAGSFSLSVTERWAGQDTRRPIQPGAVCQVFIDGDTVLTGYIDDAEASYNGQEHTVTVSGRDKTADLVDCAAVITEWKGRTLYDVAVELCRPFGVTVVDQANALARFATYKPEPGETVFEALEAAARHRAVWLATDGFGQLVITRANRTPAADSLVLGGNIKQAEGKQSLRECFSEYRALGQQASDPFAAEELAQAYHVKAVARDPRVSRYRPTIIMAEQSLDAIGAQQRADWEARRRYGQAEAITYHVVGFRGRNGSLWQPNTLAQVDDAFNGINGHRLISSVVYVIDENGARTEITVKPREAFELMPLPEPVAEDDVWGA